MKNILVVLLCIAAPFSAGASPTLELEDVVTSALTHYPEVGKALSNIQAAQQEVIAAEGRFDRYIDGSVDSRLNGYYDSKQATARIVQPLKPFNAEIYGGYRRSDGNFPVYEDALVTADQGEATIGVVLSLLRNRAIDSDRAALAGQNIDTDIAELELLQTKLRVQEQAMRAYAGWVAAGWTLKVYEGLFSLAQKRQRALQQRADKGDIAAITVVENQQFILQRQAGLRQAKQKFVSASNTLSLFWRDADAKPIVPTLANIPERSSNLIEPPTIPDVGDLLVRRPDFQILQQYIAKQQIQAQLGENSILPKLDVKVENNTDIGNGDSRAREGNETKLGLKLAIPLQQRFGEGKQQAAKARIKSLLFDKRLLQDQLAANLRTLQENMDAVRRIAALSEEEIHVTKQMEDAERERFRNGQSDFFIVNIREVNSANAEMKRINALQQYIETLAALYQITLEIVND